MRLNASDSRHVRALLTATRAPLGVPVPGVVTPYSHDRVRLWRRRPELEQVVVHHSLRELVGRADVTPTSADSEPVRGADLSVGQRPALDLHVLGLRRQHVIDVSGQRDPGMVGW
jgi:hypothetical protein